MGDVEDDGTFVWAAFAAPVAGAGVRAAVAGVFLAAGAAAGGPPAGGHDGDAVVAAFGFAADAFAHLFPGGAVAGSFAGKCVGDFVEDGLADLAFVVGHDKVEGEFDAFFAIPAEAQGAFAAIPCKTPPASGEKVGHEFFSELPAGCG